VALFAVPESTLYWLLIPLAGAMTQGIGTLIIAYAVQLKGIGNVYAGTTLGLVGGMANLGGFVMPIVGGRLAEISQTWPFFLWAALSLSGAACFVFLKGMRER
jgi:hypothetical protein